MSSCMIIPFPTQKSGAIDRWSHYVAAAYGIIAVLLVVYGPSLYLAAGMQATLGESAALMSSDTGIE
jgi:hypothetical protein